MSPRRFFAAVLRSSRLRFAAAVVCLVAQSFAVVHLFAMHHVRCAEHGDMLHVEGTAAAREEVADTDGDTLGAAQQAIEGHQGDHCTALSERRDTRTGAFSISALVLAEMSPELPARAFAPRTTQDLYRLAPKVSPPTVA